MEESSHGRSAQQHALIQGTRKNHSYWDGLLMCVLRGAGLVSPSNGIAGKTYYSSSITVESLQPESCVSQAEHGEHQENNCHHSG